MPQLLLTHQIILLRIPPQKNLSISAKEGAQDMDRDE